jgi:hypothetical protein
MASALFNFALLNHLGSSRVLYQAVYNPFVWVLRPTLRFGFLVMTSWATLASDECARKQVPGLPSSMR